MIRRWLALGALASTAFLGACGGGEVVVQAQVANSEGQVTPLKDLEVQALPYDRDAIFDSLAKAYAQPEPAIPDSLLQLQTEIAQAQEDLTVAQNEWGTLRDSLKGLSDRLARMNRASPQYVVLFREFDPLQSRVNAADRAMKAAFSKFDGLQKRFTSQSNEIKLLREQWADEAFASVDSIIDARLKEIGKKVVADTTDAQGVARFDLPKGKWWFYAYYELPFNELYWNVPLDVKHGQPMQLILDRKAAKVRPLL